MPPQRWRRQAEIIANLLGEVVRRQVPLFGRVGGENTYAKTPSGKIGYTYWIPRWQLQHIFVEHIFDLELSCNGVLKFLHPVLYIQDTT